jgi:TolA-binding protein
MVAGAHGRGGLRWSACALSALADMPAAWFHVRMRARILAARVHTKSGSSVEQELQELREQLQALQARIAELEKKPKTPSGGGTAR